MATTTSSTSCKLCYEKYSIRHPHRIPRSLICSHVYCTECVEKLKQLQGLSIECPICFCVTVIPSKGVDYLPKQLDVLGITEGSKVYEKCKHCIKTTYPPKSATLHCMDCQNFFCGACSDKTHLQIDNQNHIVRLASSNDDLRLSRNSSRTSSADSTRYRRSPADERSSRSSISPICLEHQQYLTLFCEKKQIRICSKCKLSPEHRQHDCNLGEKNEEEERNMLIDLKLEQAFNEILPQTYYELDEAVSVLSKMRGDVQKIMEDLKRNSTVTKENVQRYFREMRNVVDAMEEQTLDEVNMIFNSKLKRLKDQCRNMIEITNCSREVGEEVDKVVDMDYYQMLVEKKKVEVDIISSLENMKNISINENAELFVQFPKHEEILSGIRNSPFIVRAPPPPEKFVCTLTEANRVSLTWEPPSNLKYTYPPSLYAVYASIGENDSFVLLTKIKTKRYSIDVNDPLLCNKQLVQFQVSAINVVAEGKPCFPICIRLVVTRSLDD